MCCEKYSILHVQEYSVVRRLLPLMLNKNPRERATVSEILQDTELRASQQNPQHGKVLLLRQKRVHVILFLFHSGHWSDIYDKEDT